MPHPSFVSTHYFTVVKAILCSAFSLFLCGKSFSQKSSERELLFLKNHIAAGFEIPFLVTQQEEHKGLGSLKVRTLPGFALKVEYTYNFNEYIGITSGSKFGVQIFGYSAAADAENFFISKDLSRKYFQMVPFFSIPLMLNLRIFISERNLLQVDLGAAVTFFTPGNTLSTMSYRNGTATEQVSEMNLHFAEPPQFTLHAGLSYGLVVRNGNILKAGVSYDFGKRKMMKGDYSFHSHDVTVGSGKIFSSLNHLSVGVTYVFTRDVGLQKD